MERKILHSDANAFYASVECVLNPDLKGKAVAVCGSQEERHGIVLAKSELAKRAGIKTGMTNWQAKRLCSELVIVPPRHDIYAKFSEALHEIYIRYTDYVEPFGLDECWLDVTRSSRAPYDIAESIRQTVKGELGLTVSVGVSFNKVFAKLGSDMKKPDAVTVITRDNFKDTVWKLPCSDMIYCGKATTEKLKKLGVRTIGELARFPQDVLLKVFGKNGGKLWQYANGMDNDPVARYDTCEQAKSVGHGVTCVADLVNAEEAGTVIVSLTQEIGQKLRKMRLRARGVQVTVRDKDLSFESWQAQLEAPTQSAAVLAAAGSELLKKRYAWRKPIRALTVSAIRLESVDKPDQLSLFQTDDKRERVENTLDEIRSKFGDGAIRPATLLGESKLPPHGGNNL